MPLSPHTLSSHISISISHSSSSYRTLLSSLYFYLILPCFLARGISTSFFSGFRVIRVGCVWIGFGIYHFLAISVSFEASISISSFLPDLSSIISSPSYWSSLLPSVLNGTYSHESSSYTSHVSDEGWILMMPWIGLLIIAFVWGSRSLVGLLVSSLLGCLELWILIMALVWFSFLFDDLIRTAWFSVEIVASQPFSSFSVSQRHTIPSFASNSSYSAPVPSVDSAYSSNPSPL